MVLPRTVRQTAQVAEHQDMHIYINNGTYTWDRWIVQLLLWTSPYKLLALYYSYYEGLTCCSNFLAFSTSPLRQYTPERLNSITARALPKLSGNCSTLGSERAAGKEVDVLGEDT